MDGRVGGHAGRRGHGFVGRQRIGRRGDFRLHLGAEHFVHIAIGEIERGRALDHADAGRTGENPFLRGGEIDRRARRLALQRIGGERAEDDPRLALLQQVKRLRHLSVDGQQVGLEFDQLLEARLGILFRRGHGLAGCQMRRHEKIGETFRVLQRRQDHPALEFRVPYVAP